MTGIERCDFYKFWNVTSCARL